jgi:hypothetical protein
MKFLYHHTRLHGLLSTWAKNEELNIAGFYFWNSGNSMQMSFDGLLRTLLHTCFSEDNALFKSALQERWDEFVAFGGGRDAFKEAELLRMFESVVSNTSRKFFFLIDGLDEFAGEPRKIARFVLSAARPNVKLCVASRPWLPFEDAFKQRPSLLLERLTWNDITLYVTERLQTNEHYKRLKDYEPRSVGSLIPEIVKKACGVFLWVYLVVDSLLVGLSNADRVSTLQARLHAVPSNLESLFDVIMDRMEPRYFQQACETFRLMRTYRDTPPYATGFGVSDVSPTLLGLYFADEPEIKASIAASRKPLRAVEALAMAEQMRRRLSARCKGLLEVQAAFDPTKHGPRHGSSELPSYDHTVTYLHRTARDWIESGERWKAVLGSSSQNSFVPEERWANSNLWLLKVHPLILKSYYHSKFITRQCLDSAIAIYFLKGSVQAVYLDEVFLIGSPVQITSSEEPIAVKWWSELLVTHISLLKYLMLLLTRTQAANRKEVIQTARLVVRNGPNVIGDPGSKTFRELKKTMDYHSTRRSFRWLRQRPVIPPYD